MFNSMHSSCSPFCSACPQCDATFTRVCRAIFALSISSDWHLDRCFAKTSKVQVSNCTPCTQNLSHIIHSPDISVLSSSPLKPTKRKMGKMSSLNRLAPDPEVGVDRHLLKVKAKLPLPSRLHQLLWQCQQHLVLPVIIDNTRRPAVCAILLCCTNRLKIAYSWISTTPSTPRRHDGSSVCPGHRAPYFGYQAASS